MKGLLRIIYPHQLFEQLPNEHSVMLVEDDLFFNQYSFHQQKLVLHRASMKRYEARLRSEGKEVSYIESIDERNQTAHLFRWLSDNGYQEVVVYDPEDYLLNRRIDRYSERFGVKVKKEASLNFLNSKEEIQAFYKDRKRYFLTDFYIAERKKRKILLDGMGKPLGEKWTFDTENRQKMPAGMKVPEVHQFKERPEVKEAKEYVSTHFGTNYGSLETFNYPIDAEEAKVVLRDFLHNRWSHYGVYQDAIVKGESYLFHSLLTPALNIGLLSPNQIVQESLEYASSHEVPMNSVEGFIRQVVGWREYIRAVYFLEGVKERTTNYWGHKRKIPISFWQGTTGILPVDEVVQRLNKTAYNHHIERLMVLGNFFLLCEFDPDEVYKWFMEMYIDSYDWVMVPNVYGMTQFADGGLMSTKPYISGSNYLHKMSNYPKGPWSEVWDALFWNFIDKHRDFFLQNPRLSMMVRTWDKMLPAKRTFLLEKAERYFASLDKENEG